MQPQTTPARIVEADGHINLGWFDKPFSLANLRDAKPEHTLGRLGGGSLDVLERKFRRLRLKEWQYVSVVTEQTLFACAVVNVGYAGTGFAYVVDRKTGERTEWATQIPFARGVQVAESSVAGTSRIEQPGWGHIEIRNHPKTHLREISVRLHGELGDRPKPPLRVNLTMHDEPEQIQPIVVVERCAPGHWLYTHKSYGLATEGTIECGALRDAPKRGEALAGFDYNSGYRERRTWWNWAAASGRTEEGTIVGFNLTAHRPWDSNGSQRGEAADALDCGAWIDGELIKLERVDFAYDPENLMGPWRVFDTEGLVDLHFKPLGERSENINFGLMASQFHQPYGTFSGTLKNRSGRCAKLDGVFGVTEQHYAVW